MGTNKHQSIGIVLVSDFSGLFPEYRSQSCHRRLQIDGRTKARYVAATRALEDAVKGREEKWILQVSS